MFESSRSSDPSRRELTSAHYLLIGFLFVALLVRINAARAPNIVHPDGIFQTLEPAHRLAYGYGVVTWEWRDGIRSWVFPGFLAVVMRTTAWLGLGSSGYMWAISIVLALVSLVTVWFGFAWAKRVSGVEAGIIAAGACAMWYGLIDFAPCALTEVVAAHLLLPGLYFGTDWHELPESKRMFLAALFCGFAVCLRVQLAPAVIFAMVYFCYTNCRKRVFPLTAGFLVSIFAFGLVDAFTWGYPFQSIFKYFWLNAIEGRSALYGTQPWFWYLLVLVTQMLPLLVLALFGFRRSPFLGWIALFILASHSVIGHKESRFIYPVMPLVVTLAAIGIVEIANDINASFKKPVLRAKAIVGMGLLCCGLLSYWFAPRFPYWQKGAGGIAAFEQLSQDPAVCGVALYDVPWFDTGGYAHLHKNIPILLIPNEHMLRSETASFNAILAHQIGVNTFDSFNLSECWNETCLYRRSGSCAVPDKSYEVNEVLRITGN